MLTLQTAGYVTKRLKISADIWLFWATLRCSDLLELVGQISIQPGSAQKD